MGFGIVYDTATGVIQSSTSPELPPEQELPEGRAQLVLSEEIDIAFKKVSLQTLTIVPNYAPIASRELRDSDLTVIRCYEEGVAVPEDWVAYRSTLRGIVSGTIDGPLPDKPPYP